MAQMNLSIKKNRLRNIVNRLKVGKGEGLGEGWNGRLSLANVSFIYSMNKQQGAYCVAQGAIFNTL